MRRAHNVRHALVRCTPRHGQRALQVGRPVIHSVNQMMMNIDHGRISFRCSAQLVQLHRAAVLYSLPTPPIIDAKIPHPSADPSSASLDRSGCGIMPSTFRPSFRIPAMLLSDPLGFASARDLALRRRVAERNPILRLQPLQLFRLAEIVPFHVPDRNLAAPRPSSVDS